MNALVCSSYGPLNTIIWLYTLVMLVYAVASWIPDIRGRWTDYVAMLVEPVLAPVRRIVPPAGGIDWSFLIVIVLLGVLNRFIAGLALSHCGF